MKQKPFTIPSTKLNTLDVLKFFRYACLAAMVTGPVITEAKVPANHTKQAVDTKVTGKVTDTNGEEVPGVAVRVKNTNKGTNTDINGAFSLTVGDNAVLVFSSVGYKTQEVAVNGKSVINVVLQPSSTELEQVVFVGYGTQRKMDVTGSVVSVKGEDISKQASVNAVSALQGKVAGVQITNSGSPGAAPQIRIRGLGTVYGNPNPLYVVDGVWFDDISFLNPADIETMNVLKDASAQSIYGIRAANGVILITTKKGKADQSNITYNASYGVQRVTNQLEMANANEFATMVNELSIANGGSQLLTAANFGKGTDWYRQVLRSAPVTNHQISMSGGSQKSTYNFSLGYLNQAGIVEGNDYQRYTARLQNDYQISKHLKIGYSATGAANTSNDIPESIFRQLYAASPVVPVRYADGTYGDPSDYNLGDGANFNPQVTLDYYNKKSKGYRLTGNVFADLNFAKHFTFHTSLGGEFRQNEITDYTPVYTATLKQRSTVSTLSMSRAETRNWILENTLSYDNTFNNDHTVRVLLGQSAQSYRSYGYTASAQNVPNTSDGDLYIKLGNVDGRQITDYGDLNTIASYFGRVNYSFKNRYMLNASLRADGSSKFFGDNRWGYFPSVGLGWVVTDEPFMENQSTFDNLKFRASWGKVGNASVPSNISVLRVNQDPNLTAIFGDQIYTGGSINSVVPPTTYWERSVGTDIGVEMAFLKNKLTLEADYYNKKTELAIFDIPIPSSIGTGSSTITGNQADIQNRGYEFAITWRNTVSKDFSYSISANAGINNNKVLSVVTGSNPIYAGGSASTGGALSTRTIVGQPIGQFFGYIVDGIFQNNTEISSSAQPNAKPGDFKYRDISGPNGVPDGVITDLDRAPIGNPNPKYSYGINSNFMYKEFDLTLDFQGVAGVDIYNANLGLRYGNENFTKDFYNNRWHGEGTSNTYPSANIGGGDNYKPNSFFVESGAYFRVRNIQLGYTLPNALTDKLHIKKLRVFANAQNAFNFFKYRGFSPEVSGAYKNSGEVVTGTTATINSGIDTNVYPLFATYNFGLNVTF
ncbi:SusC/RagA family TonB-linked outer membrane protein [Flectobacillus major]|uniref:SusC/RagA family TonB-linked outer membrane protein n=1 Tax=Flectobacillus major TaxID=103 RepID=UPI0004150D8B|nr:TonB-dependent receptor [Flectobacillus major]